MLLFGGFIWQALGDQSLCTERPEAQTIHHSERTPRKLPTVAPAAGSLRLSNSRHSLAGVDQRRRSKAMPVVIL
jgi:hypothetical protein